MRTYKDKTIKALDTVYCDICGGSTTILEQIGPDYATLESCWGYGSLNDGIKYDLQFCEHCFNEMLGTIKQKRQKILGSLKYPYPIDPLNGITYS